MTKFQKFLGLAFAGGILFDLYDDWNFIFVSQQDDRHLLFLMVVSIVIVPIYIISDFILLPMGRFSDISSMQPKIVNKLAYFCLEFVNLTFFVTNTDDSKRRLKMKKLL